MRKIVWAGLGLFLATMGIILYLVMKPNVETVDLDKKSDLYLFTEDGITSLVVADNQLRESKKQETDLSLVIAVGSQLINNRYFVFSESEGNYLLSLDLKKNQLRREPRKEMMYDPVFVGEEGVYNIIDDKIYAYDQKGRKRKSVTLKDKNLYISNHKSASKDGLLYLIGEVYDNDDKALSTYDSYLYIFKESDLTLVDKILLTDGSENMGDISDLVIVGEDLYYTISDFSTTLDKKDVDYMPSSSLVKLNLTTFEKSTVRLTQASPLLLHASSDGKQLFVEHSSYEKNSLVLTVIDIESGHQDIINLSEDLALKGEYPVLQQLVALPNGQIAFTIQGSFDAVTSQHLDDKVYLYDTVNHKLLSELRLSGQVSIGLIGNTK